MEATKTIAVKNEISAAITLFFVAPLVAEFLLGDFPLKWLPLLLVLAPMYGGGAIVIREMTRRCGRGWPCILLLGAAYAVLEEAFVTQSLFNPDYLHMHLHFLAPAYIPALGIGGWWTLLMLNVHAFWSIGVSIALVEALTPEQVRSPWLGRVGDSVFAAVFVVGAVANAAIGYKQNRFVASHAQFLSAGIVCVALIAAAFLLPAGGGEAKSGGYVPSPWVTGAAAFVLGFVVIGAPPKWGWGACAQMLAADLVFLMLVGVLSRRSGWRPVHAMSVAGGGALMYGVHAFLQMPVVPSSVVMARVSNAVFLVAAIAVVAVAARRTSRTVDVGQLAGE
jgi:hypothetical protein